MRLWKWFKWSSKFFVWFLQIQSRRNWSLPIKLKKKKKEIKIKIKFGKEMFFLVFSCFFLILKKEKKVLKFQVEKKISFSNFLVFWSCKSFFPKLEHICFFFYHWQTLYHQEPPFCQIFLNLSLLKHFESLLVKANRNILNLSLPNPTAITLDLSLSNLEKDLECPQQRFGVPTANK